MASTFVLGCDSVEPSVENVLVVEGFFNAGAPLPIVTLSKVQTLETSLSASPVYIRDASFRVFIDNVEIPYGPSQTTPGNYTPLETPVPIVPSNAHLRAEIEWQAQRATTRDVIPPSIKIDSVAIEIPAKPVTAILVDTLRLDNPNVGARKGFIYPIDVTIMWTPDPIAVPADSAYWIETRLIPQSEFSSTVLDVFLLTEEVQLESALSAQGSVLKSWSGVYAVPVADSLSPPPAHNLTIQLIRSTKAYADFAASRNSPERREPISNIDGAIGVLAGIALDAIEYEVRDGLATARE